MREERIVKKTNFPFLSLFFLFVPFHCVTVQSRRLFANWQAMPATHAHSAFFYVELICNFWFIIELFIRFIVSMTATTVYDPLRHHHRMTYQFLCTLSGLVGRQLVNVI
jgi:hypothetical protein